MATPQLDVYLPDGTVQNFPLTDERVVVGTSTRCQVMIDRPELAPEHLLLSPRPDGCWVAVARGVATPTLVDNMPFERGMVSWGKPIQVGQVRMVLADGTRAKANKDKDKEKKEEKVSPVLLVVAVLVMGMAAWTLLTEPTNLAAPGRVSTPPPALFEDLNRPCPQADPSLVAATADESTRIALSKAERMPFRTQDGIEAVTYYAQAAACFRSAGNNEAATEAMRRANGLRARLEEEYTAHRFRLERALEQTRYEDALYEVKMLTALVTHRRGPYLTALNTLERQLTIRIDQAAAANR
ncbi:MAG: hypothetical protein U0326_26770 [Polyangiales bacterium]